jgi:hypothetical protein
MNTVWAKSSLSFANGNCVEVASLPGGQVGVRNSRDPEGPVLRFSREEWDAFLGGARLGEFDRYGSTVGRRSGQLGASFAIDLRGGDAAVT